MLRCPVCGAAQTDPPRVLPEPTIDLRVLEIDEPVELDLAELDETGRRRLQDVLDAHAVPHRWDGPLLVVPAEADELVRSALSPPAPDRPRVMAEAPPARPGARPGARLRPPELAPRTIRVLAGVADWLLLTLFAYLPAFAFLRADRPNGTTTISDLGRWVVTTSPFLYAFVAIGLSGATLGKVLFRIHVRDLDGNPPGWRAAAIRAAIPSAVSLVGTALPTSPLFDSEVGAWIGTLWFLAVYVPLLTHPRRQGLHDRLAGTVVMARPVASPALVHHPLE